MTITTAELHPKAAEERSRVVTLTPAPAVDRVYVVDGLQTGHVNRARHIEAHIAGNGVNLARNLHAAGNTVRAVVPLSVEAAADLDGEQDLFRIVPVPHPLRVNAVIIGADGVTTNVNQAAHPLAGEDWRALFHAVAQESDRIAADWVVIGGTLTGSADHVTETAADMLRVAQATGARICLDSPGPVIADWLRHRVPLDLISPNVHELEEATGTTISTMGAAVDAAARIIDRGVGSVMVSLGTHGVVMVTPRIRVWARTAQAGVVNTTGAGDAALSGLMAHWTGADDRDEIENGITRAVRWGRAAVGVISSTISPSDVVATRVELDDPPPSLSLL